MNARRFVNVETATTAAAKTVPANVLLKVLLAVTIMVGFGAAVPSPASAATTLSTRQAQWNLAGLGYLPYSGIDGIVGTNTRNAVIGFQNSECLNADGIVGASTSARLVGLMKRVQAKLGVAQDGLNGPNTKAAIVAYQKTHSLTPDGMAGAATLTKMGLFVVADCWPRLICAPGTTSLGTAQTVYRSGVPKKMRLCAIPGFRSTGEESRPGNTYYVAGANGNVIVAADVSGKVLAMFRKAKSQGVVMTAESSFRSMRHQEAICRGNSGCRNGDYTYIARPGYSNHQGGTAIDFGNVGVNSSASTSCAQRATNWQSETWKWLYRNAKSFGFRQYAAESWHWDTMTGPDRC